MIDPAIEAAIDQRLDQLEQKTSSEIAVATIQSLAGMSSTDYANRLFKQWGVGQATRDNGVLVVISIDDRDMAIEVGYGLEGVLPDGLAGQVIREDFTPRCKANDYSGGIRSGVNRVADIVENQQVLTPEELAKFNDTGSGAGVPWYILIPFFGLFVTIGFGMVGIGLRTQTGFPLLFGSLFGAMPLVMSMLFSPALASRTLVPWTLVMGQRRFVVWFIRRFEQQFWRRRIGRRRRLREMVGAGMRRCAGATVLCLIAGCSYMPGQREMERTQEVLRLIDSVSEVHFTCGGQFLASDSLCTDVAMKDGSRLRFEHVGFNSFGSTAVNVFVAKAGGLVPRVASCDGVGAPNFHRDSALGHRFHPTLIDVKDAAFRYRDVYEEIEFWPQCPQFWEVQDKRGLNYRYCARRESAAEEPPPPVTCR